MEELTDGQLIQKYLAGDQPSLEKLIKKYLKQVYGLAFNYINSQAEAEDITQEVFVRAWKNIKKFKRDENFKSWLLTIAKNASIDYLRKKKCVPLSQFDNEDGGNLLANTLSDIGPLPDKLVDDKKAGQVISAALDWLPEKYRTVLALYYRSDLNFREIAESLGESINTIKSRHRRGLLALRGILTD